MVHAFRILEETCRDRDEESLRKVAVLIPSPASLIPFVQGAVSRFDQEAKNLPFNITLGYPLERTPMMQLVDSLLTVLENTQGGRDGGRRLPAAYPPSLRENIGRRRRPGTLEKGDSFARGHHRRRQPDPFLGPRTWKRSSPSEPWAAAAEDGNLSGPGRSRPRSPGCTSASCRRGIKRRRRQLLAFLRRALESVGSEANREAHLFLNEYAAAALARAGGAGGFSPRPTGRRFARRRRRQPWPPWCAAISAAARSASWARRCRGSR